MIRLVDDALIPWSWALAGWSIRWAVLIAGLALGFRFLPPRRAATRHLLAATVLVIGLALPLAPGWTAWRLAPPPTVEPPAPARPVVREAPALIFDEPAAPLDLRPPVEPAPSRPAPLAPTAARRPPAGGGRAADLGPARVGWLVVGLAWLAGTLIGLTRLAAGLMLLARLRATAMPVAAGLRPDFEAARAAADLRRRVDLATTPAVGSPVALGGRRPAILVPADWPDWSPEARRAAVLHELAHLARRDDAWKLLAELARCPFWFHPGVAWLASRLDREAELAADEVAVARGVAPVDLARLLLACARQPHRLDRRALAFSNPGTVTTRINRLLEPDMPRAPLPPAPLRRLALVVPILALAFAIGGARVGPVAAQAPASPAVSLTPQPAAAAVGPAPLTVFVRDDQGRPIEGATVAIASNLDATDRRVASTDAGGGVRFDRLARRWDVVIAHRPGYAFDSADSTIMAEPATATLTLHRPRELTGTIVDAGGRPVAGAEVRVGTAFGQGHFSYLGRNSDRIVRGTAIEGAIMTRADAAGRFRLAALPDGAKISLVAAAAGHGTTESDGIALRPGNPGQDLPATRIALLPEARIEGRVVTRLPGVVVGSLSVHVQGNGEGPIEASATTDAEGRFVVGGLTEGRAYACLVDLPPDSPWTYLPAANFRLVAGAPAVATVELIAGGVASGSVRDPAGKPIAGVEVSAFQNMPRDQKGSSLGSPPLRTVTDAGGRYHFRCRPGEVTIHLITNPGKPIDFIHRSLTIVEGQPAVEVEPVLIDTGVLLAGRLVDAAGVPLAGAKIEPAVSGRISMSTISFTGSDGITVHSTPPAPPAVPTTDAQGRFVVRNENKNGQPVPADRAVLFEVMLADGRKFEVAAVPTRAGSEATIKLPAFGAGGPAGPTQVASDELAGLVVDSQGRPLAGGLVAAGDEGAGAREVLTDAAGRFSLQGFGRAPATLRIGKEGYAPLHYRYPPPGRTGWVVPLDDRSYFEGRVLAPDGSPVADAPIRVEGGSKMLDGFERPDDFGGRSGPDGRYRLHLMPGMYEFQVRVPGVGALRLARQVSGTDEVRPLDLRLDPPVEFRARVVDAGTGAPVAGFTLGNKQDPSIGGTSDAAGLIRIVDMLPGRFVFGANRADDSGRWWSPDALAPRYREPKADRFINNSGWLDFDIRPGMEPVTIRAERAATIRGRVVAPDGTPRGGATVRLGATRSGDQALNPDRYQVRADAAGAFAIRLPASHDEAYRVVAHDGQPEATGTWTDGISPFLPTRPGEVVAAGDLRLTRPATVEGRVLDAQGRPVANEEVHVSTEVRPFELTTAGRARTGPDGTFTIASLGPGSYSVAIEPFAHEPSPAWGQTVVVVQLAEGETRAGLALVKRTAPAAASGGARVGAVVQPSSFVVPASPPQAPARPAPVAPGPGIKLAGRVIDATGRPVGGAKVEVADMQTLATVSPHQLVETDAEGRFRVDKLGDNRPIPAGPGHLVVVRLSDGRSFDVAAVPPQDGAEATVRLPVQLVGGPVGPAEVAADEVAGVVVDARGRPVAGAAVGSVASYRPREGVSDERGHFRFRTRQGETTEFRVSKAGYAPADFLRYPIGPAGLVVVLDEQTYFEGRVLGPDGKPAGDVAIQADSGPKRGTGGILTACMTQGRSGPDGRYRLAVAPGVYEFQVRVPGVGVLRLPDQAIAPDEAQALDLKLIPGIEFRARVVDAADGKPVTGFPLKGPPETPVEAVTDADGMIRLADLMPGPFQFLPNRTNEDYRRWWSDTCLSESNRYRATGRTTKFRRNFDGLDFDMQPGMPIATIQVERAVTIRGVVLDPDGQPVANATVAPALTGSGNSLTGDMRFSVPTGANGSFVARLPASGEADYNLIAHDGNLDKTRAWSNGVGEPFRTVPGQVIAGVTLRLTRPATVRGRVVDEAGRPVANREVFTNATDERDNRYYNPTARSAADGTFVLAGIRPGEQFINVRFRLVPGQASLPGSSAKLTLEPGEIKEGVTLTVSSRP